ncbi:MAG: hypothetical protein A3E19_06535 [Planctomycetes bacterium RIFCSPHIGHO2_12_FULL_52_36]|nr:MAG: hypothetical protein A3E19_06535 [Planctomycetes bacterium RIFCSPHIGHO2_12_FULL_52_36]
MDWQKVYGGANWDRAYSIQQTSDGGYVVAGETSSFGAGRPDFWVLKLRHYGTVEWQKTYGGTDQDEAHSIQQTSDGGYIVAGSTWSFGAGGEDIWVLKLKADGTVEWQKTYGGGNWDGAYSVHETSDGGYIVAGDTSSFGTGGPAVWVLKLGPDGTVEWQKAYGGDDLDRAYSVHETNDGGYVVAGRRTMSLGAGGEKIPDIWVLKLRPNGTVEWQKTYGGGNWDGAYSVHETSDGGYIVAGDTSSFGTGGPAVWVLKLGPDGTVEWQKAYGGDDLDRAYSVHETNDGGYVVAGRRTMSLGAGGEKIPDIWVLKLRPNGTVDWQKTYGKEGGWEVAGSIHETRDGGYIMAGETGNAHTGTGTLSISGIKVWVLKLSPDGTVDWQKTYGGGNLDRADSIRETSDGGYIVAGNTSSFGDRYGDFWVLKLSPDGSINPSCDFIGNITTPGIDSNATVLDTRASVRDSNVRPQNSSTMSQDTNASVNILCP